MELPQCLQAWCQLCIVNRALRRFMGNSIVNQILFFEIPCRLYNIGNGLLLNEGGCGDSAEKRFRSNSSIDFKFGPGVDCFHPYASGNISHKSERKSPQDFVMLFFDEIEGEFFILKGNSEMLRPRGVMSLLRRIGRWKEIDHREADRFIQPIGIGKECP